MHPLSKLLPLNQSRQGWCAKEAISPLIEKDFYQTKPHRDHIDKKATVTRGLSS
jgi:hypothetical protein